MENSNNTGKLLGALLLGAAIGGTLGILFAPDKGSATRKKLTSGRDELTDSIKEKFNDFLEEVQKEVVSVRERATEFMENGSAKTEKVK